MVGAAVGATGAERGRGICGPGVWHPVAGRALEQRCPVSHCTWSAEASECCMSRPGTAPPICRGHTVHVSRRPQGATPRGLTVRSRCQMGCRCERCERPATPFCVLRGCMLQLCKCFCACGNCAGALVGARDRGGHPPGTQNGPPHGVRDAVMHHNLLLNACRRDRGAGMDIRVIPSAGIGRAAPPAASGARTGHWHI